MLRTLTSSINNIENTLHGTESERKKMAPSPKDSKESTQVLIEALTRAVPSDAHVFNLRLDRSSKESPVEDTCSRCGEQNPPMESKCTGYSLRHVFAQGHNTCILCGVQQPLAGSKCTGKR